MRWRKSSSCCCCNMTLLIERPASVAAIERIDISIDECKKPHVLPGPPRRERDGLLRANQVCQRCSPSRTPRCMSFSSLGFGLGGLQVQNLLLQKVPGKLNDELTTTDAMRRKLAHGIGQALQKCCRYVHTRAHSCLARSASRHALMHTDECMHAHVHAQKCAFT